MRRILPILALAAGAALLTVPTGTWGQQADQQNPPANSSGSASASGGNAANSSASAPQASGQEDSLAEAARKARAEKKDQAKPPRVFDNDNLPGGVTVTAKTDEAKKDDATDATGDQKPAAAGEKAWRDKFAGLRAKLDRDKEDLEVMQRELGVLNLQNYSDPNKGLQQELTRSDINNKVAAIDAKQKTIAADQQAIDDAEEDLRKSGGDPGWGR
jgi:hypothetical protein